MGKTGLLRPASKPPGEKPGQDAPRSKKEIVGTALMTGAKHAVPVLKAVSKIPVVGRALDGGKGTKTAALILAIVLPAAVITSALTPVIASMGIFSALTSQVTTITQAAEAAKDSGAKGAKLVDTDADSGADTNLSALAAECQQYANANATDDTAQDHCSFDFTTDGSGGSGGSGGSQVAASGDRKAIVEYAKTFLGTPYVWGGTTPAGFDCSGFTSYVFAHFGINLPRTSQAQMNEGTEVSLDDAQPGDLVWMRGGGHVGIYIGDHKVIHSPKTGDVVKISDISDWDSSGYGLRRLFDGDTVNGGSK